ncbi:MAG: NAD-dependent epimerase/dehydratase family protein [Desulfovibrio sp.]
MSSFYLEQDITDILERIDDIKDAFIGKTILFSGGCGFLGKYFSQVCGRLNDLYPDTPCKLILLDNLITADTTTELCPSNGHITFLEHDIIKPMENPPEDIDYVIHAAGIASPFYYRAYPLETLDVGVIGTRNMLEVARKSRAKFLFFSSSEIYGDPDAKHVPMQESYKGNVSCIGPRACYDESKRVGETLCYIYQQQYGVHTNIVRPFNVYGPGMKEKDYRVLPNFASRIKGGKPLQVYGTGNQTRTFCYISDFMNGCMRILASGVPGEAYNIGNPEPEVSILELAEVTSKVAKQKVETNIIEYPDSYPADEPMRRCPDIRKAELQLKFHPQMDLEEGLRRFYQWTDATYEGKQ